MIDLVMTIKTHTESSKSKLSSGIFGHVKVLLFYILGGSFLKPRSPYSYEPLSEFPNNDPLS